MLDPKSEESLDALYGASATLSKQLKNLVMKRLRRCRSESGKAAEMTAQFLFFRAMAEEMAEIVVTDENEEFLRGFTDDLKTKVEKR